MISRSVRLVQNLYQVLGVTTHATFDAIRKAYRYKAKSAHPDQGGSKEAWERLQLAYTVLSDPNQRKEYDRSGEIPDQDAVKPEEERRVKVLHLINRLIRETLLAEGRDILALDIPKEMIKGLGETRQKIEAQITRCNKLEKRAIITLLRWKKKTEGENFVVTFTQTVIDDLRKDLHTLAKEEEILKAAEELLKDYEFTFDKPKPAEPYAAQALSKQDLDEAMMQMIRQSRFGQR